MIISRKAFFSIALVVLCAQSAFPDVKNADKAGSWYPADKAQLSKMLDGYLKKAVPKEVEGNVILRNNTMENNNIDITIDPGYPSEVIVR